MIISIIFVILVVITVVVAGLSNNNNSGVKRVQRIRETEGEREERLAKIMERIKELEEKDPDTYKYKGSKVKQEEKDKRVAELDANYGKCLRAIVNPYDSYKDDIRVYEESKVVVIKDRVYNYKDILGCELRDNSCTTTVNGGITSNPNTMGTLSRAAVGSIIGGSTGAIIGGMTAGREHRVAPSVSITNHDYSVYVNVRSIEKPVVKLEYHEKYDAAIEVVGIINIIVQQSVH